MRASIAHRPTQPDAPGFTLIELLVVILIIGILAGVAVPLFLSQRTKANDAQAKVVVHTAQTAMETYATDNGGSYAGSNLLSSLTAIEPALVLSSSSNAFLSTVAGTTSTYTITAYSPADSETFSLTDVAGAVTRRCTPANSGGCSASGDW